MRLLPLLAALLLLPVAEAAAQGGTAARPRKIGEFGPWTAATHTENGARICYAFARASRSEGVAGRQPANVLLMVTHRPDRRDQVTLRAGYAYPRSSEGDPVRLTVGSNTLGLYTAGDSAFARDGRGAVTSMRAGQQAQARGPGPNGRGEANDVFPLQGFAGAYEAISRECPPAAPAPPRR